MHNLFLVYFINLYMFWAFLGPTSGGTTECIQQLVLLIFFRWLSVVIVGLEPGSNPTRTTDSHLKRIIITNCCICMVVPPDGGPRYARNMYRLTKYTKNKLCIKFVFSLHDFIKMHGQQNIKYNLLLISLCMQFQFASVVLCHTVQNIWVSFHSD